MAQTNDTMEPTRVRHVVVEADRAGQRIDNFLSTELKGAPRTLIYRILRKGEVRVNRGRVQASYRLQAGDEIRIPPVRLSAAGRPPAPGRRLTDTLNSAIVYEDDALLVVNKPSGLAVHGGSGISLGLIEALRQMRPECRFLELVHRLDRDTSGCVMIAKKRSVLKALHEALRAGKITKIYHALVKGRWPDKLVKVNAPLRKNELSGGERIVRADQDGKDSLTRFRVVECFPGATLVEARPITGRTHQIRVHAQVAGHPIAGDEKYGDEAFNRRMKMLGAGRLFLHAEKLILRHPLSGEKLEVSATKDAALQGLIEALRGEFTGSRK